MARASRAKGITRVEVVVVGVVGVLVLATIPAVSRYIRTDASRATCAANLATIGKAMLTYANDYNGRLPKAGGRTSLWGQVLWWDAPDRSQAFGFAHTGDGGSATISSSLYLLVKHASVLPGAFVCPGDTGAREFKLSEFRHSSEGFTLADAWDFGPGGSEHCSYAYHLPYGLYALTTDHNPGMPVAADHNPWQASSYGPAKNLELFKPDQPPFNGTTKQAREGNSSSHGQDGQNVLFLDGHVSFEKRAYCGLENDNIYLQANYPDRGSPVGTPPFPGMQPANRMDSLLLNDPRGHRTTVTHHAPSVDSKLLKRTAVVATLDCPLPEGKNAIWCSTFQMAWDKMKNDVVGEPIEVLKAEELGGRLNRSQYPRDGLEEKSYYANAGFVKHGIIKQIQRDMAERFPSEPAPAFSSLYRKLPEAVAAYAYLNVDVGFRYPYYDHGVAFEFTDSSGASAKVTAFRPESGASIMEHASVRDQVDILYYDYGETKDADEFAVDLCRHTKPYQVVLVRMARRDSLNEAVKRVQERMREFKEDPEYDVLHKLRPIDRLVVPDMLFKLTHHFEELLGKYLGNETWTEHFIFEAMQKIDFTLSRAGVIVRSEAYFGAAGGRRPPSRRLDEPRHLHFDRPFLIYVKKRNADAAPFFVMWVDNAELMKTYE